MRAFEHFNTTGKDTCPICGTKDDKETVLIGIEGTQEGFNIQARQVHLECIDLAITDTPSKMGGEKLKIIYQIFPVKNSKEKEVE